MSVVIEQGHPVKPMMQQVQKSVRNELEYITGMSVERSVYKSKKYCRNKT